MSRTDHILPAVAKWQQRLHAEQPASQDRRARAKLRRVRSLSDVALLSDFYQFERDARAEEGSVPDEHRYPREGLALLAALLPYLKLKTNTDSHDEEAGIVAGASLARVGGTPETGSDRPRLSEGRFRRLLASGSREELLGQLVRTLRLLDGAASLSALVYDIRWWDPKFEHHPRIRWARDYYTAALADATPSDA